MSINRRDMIGGAIAASFIPLVGKGCNEDVSKPTSQINNDAKIELAETPSTYKLTEHGFIPRHTDHL